MRERALELLEGHPLALTWAANLLTRDDDAPELLVADWAAQGLPALSDPKQAQHTLEWLFGRSVRRLDKSEQMALEAAGLLARAPFPTAAIEAVLEGSGTLQPEPGRRALARLAQRNLLKRVADEADQWQFPHVLGYRFARKEDGSNPEVRVRLGEWLHGYIAELLNKDAAVSGPGVVVRALEHLGALLATDGDQRLWRPLALAAMYDFSVRLTALGRLGQVGMALDAVAAWMARFPSGKAEENYWLRERWSLVIFQGNVRVAQGDLAGALAQYRESLEVVRRLVEADESNTQWQRDLSVSREKIGDVLQAQGDLAGALAEYRESLAVRRRLVEADVSNTQWQRDLSISRNKVGDVLRAQGDLDGALAEYRESLAVRRRLVEADASNTEWQRDLSISQDRIGDVLQAQGDLAGALAEYRDSLAVRLRLVEADDLNTGWQRDLSVSQEKIGDVLQAQGDLAGALAEYRESLAVRRRLVEADASNTQWQRDLSISHDRIGDVLQAQEDLAGALAEYRESLAVRRRLMEADASNTGWQRDLAVVWRRWRRFMKGRLSARRRLSWRRRV